jgi:HEAT repeat protein
MRAASLGLASLLVVSAAADVNAQGSGQSRRDVALYARLMSMTDSRTFDMALVDSALASSWGALRAAATLAIGQVGASHGMPGAPRLRQLLSDRDLVVASNAAYALGLLRDSTPVAVAALGSALTGRARDRSSHRSRDAPVWASRRAVPNCWNWCARPIG